jgi:glycosyltransferase involved in cell wall biosynthesis
MRVVHLTASTCFGGPERQMLGLAEALSAVHRTAFLSFAEGGRCEAFLDEVRRCGFDGRALRHDTPRLWAALDELTAELERRATDVLCCHGYKADLLGRLAARRLRIPAVAVSRGWTGENLKVRLYEWLDRLHLRWLDRVVCVSEGQARKVQRAGVPAARVAVIRNATDAGRFDRPDPAYRELLQGLFPGRPGRVVGAAGRLSPEKGFGVLVQAAERLAAEDPALGFVLFGDGPLRSALERQVRAAGLQERFVLAGHRGDFDCFLPWLDLLVLPSFTEGLPNVVLEACAAGVAVVATAVGGTPEVIEEGVGGVLVPPGDPEALARRIGELLASDETRQALAGRGRRRVRDEFTFAAQARQYEQLFRELTAAAEPRAAACVRPVAPADGREGVDFPPLPRWACEHRTA